MKTRAFAATKEKSKLVETEIDIGEVGPHGVRVRISHCGLCHSDVSMLDNDWGFSQYPMVPGHEIVGVASEIGDQVKNVKVGDTVGVGWFSSSCMSCERCMGGDHNMCRTAEQTIIGRHGGFADEIIADDMWTFKIPSEIDASKAGPLFCGGITVFNPIIQYDIKAHHRVGVVGIGGLGHMALSYLNAWGCDVTAFSSSESKFDEAKRLGAHQVINSRDPSSFAAIEGSLDFILVTVNVGLDWSAYLSTLAPRGRLHFVGAVGEPLNIGVFSLLGGQKSISASPLGSPETLRKMLEFTARKKIEPIVQIMPMAQCNEAMDLLKAGKARYRIVLQN